MAKQNKKKTKNQVKRNTNQNVGFLSEHNDYQSLVMTTLKEKLPYFLGGLTILLVAIVAASYFLIQRNNTQIASVKTEQKQEIKVVAMNEATPSATVAPVVSDTPVPSSTSAPTNSPVPTFTVTPSPVVAQNTQKPVNGKYKTYTVQKGDNLWKIAEKYYNSGYNAKQLAQANNIQNPSVIEVGQTIVLPTVSPEPFTVPVAGNTGIGGRADQVPPTEKGQITNNAASTGPVTFTGKEYTVQKGDTLWSISEQALGSGFAWHSIADANHVSDPIELEVGTKLKIPGR
jgi:nucleoid-associated protein YgaU